MTLSDTEFRRMQRAVSRGLEVSDAIVLRALGHTRVRLKADGSEVTAADRAAERALRQALSQAFPGDFVSGEEFGGEIPATGRGWLVDPIDGTASFALGLPTFGTLVARVEDGDPIFGCIHLPALGEATFAASGHGCWFRRAGGGARRVRVRPPRPLSVATVSLTGVHASELDRTRGPWCLAPLLRRAGRVRFVGDCLQYALLCRGLLDAAIDPAMKPWDIAALVPCVREAGGVVAPLRRSAGPLIHATSLCAATSRELLTAIRRAVRPGM